MVVPSIGSGVSDENFFDLTGHIELSLIHKIEEGGFVEYEKLLSKVRYAKSEDRSQPGDIVGKGLCIS